MLCGISPLLTGDLLKVLCDMGHGNRLVIADGNFPGPELAREGGAALIHLPGCDCLQVLEAILPLFPLDSYSSPAFVMDLTESDKVSGMQEPAMWAGFRRALNLETEKLERYAFYDQTRSSSLIVMTGEKRPYGNLMLTKGGVR